MSARESSRSFDKTWAARQAMLVFWQVGYTHATLSRLKESMAGICSPRFYAAFGSKERLFHHALKIYVREELEPCREHLRTQHTDSIGCFFRESVRRFCSESRPRGCLVNVCSQAPGLANTASGRELQEQRNQTYQELLGCLEEVLLSRQLEAVLEPPMLARLLEMFLQAICLKSREGASEDMLLALVDDMLDSLLMYGYASSASRPCALSMASRN